MLTRIKNFFKRIGLAIVAFLKPMWRTIWIALAGQGIFLVSVLTMSPLRMWENPVVNYNLYYVPLLAVILGGLFYRCCIEDSEAKGYLYGFFAALFAWSLIGEVANIPVDKGVITQFSDFNIKGLGGYFYVLAGWALLHITWRTGALKKSVCVFCMTFLSIWSFELYMDNYSSMSGDKFAIIGGLLAVAVIALLTGCCRYAWNLFKVRKPVKAIMGIVLTVVLALVTLINYRDVLGYVDPLKKMAGMSTMVLIGSLTATYIILRAAKRTESLERKTILGCIFYIVFALILMSSQWKEPQTFYVKYEAAHIGHEIEELKQDQANLERLFDYMAAKRMLKAGDYKYMYDHGILSMAKLKNLVNFGMIDGKGLEFLVTRGLITVDEFQAVLDRNMLSEADLKPLRDMGILKKDDKGRNVLQRQYLKMVKKED
jgi:hypothetical protein